MHSIHNLCFSRSWALKSNYASDAFLLWIDWHVLEWISIRRIIFFHCAACKFSKWRFSADRRTANTQSWILLYCKYRSDRPRGEQEFVHSLVLNVTPITAWWDQLRLRHEAVWLTSACSYSSKSCLLFTCPYYAVNFAKHVKNAFIKYLSFSSITSPNTMAIADDQDTLAFRRFNSYFSFSTN